MTAERFVELFQAAIVLEGSGNPFRWAARSPLVRAKGSFEDGELWCYGPTAGAAIEELAAAAALAAQQEAADARAAAEAAEAAELRLRRMMTKTEASFRKTRP